MTTNIFEAGGEFAFFDGPETTIGDLLAGFDANREGMPLTSLEYVGQFRNIPNESIASTVGKHKGIKGKPMVTLSMSGHLEGLGTPAIDTVQADQTMLAHIAASCLGGTPNRYDGGTVNAAPAPTVNTFTYTTEPTNKPVAGDLMAIVVGTNIELSVCDSYTAGAVVLGIDLSAAPATSALVYGGNSVKWAAAGKKHTYTIQNEIKACDDTDHMKQFGLFGNLSFPAASADEVQQFKYEAPNAVAFADKYTAGWVDPTSTEPASKRPQVSAGGRFIVAINTTQQPGVELDWLSMEVDMGAVFTGQPHRGDKEKLFSAVLKSRKSAPKVVINVSHDDNPAGTAATWREVWRDGGADNAFRVLCQWGTIAGEIYGYQARDMHMTGPPVKAILADGLRVWQVTLEPNVGGVTPLFSVGQF